MIWSRVLTAVVLAAGLAPQDPPVPTGVSASTPATAVIQVNWDANPAVSFNVYRSGVSQGTYVKLNGSALPGTTSSYQDSTVASGTRYFYVVRSVNGASVESANSSEVSAVATGTDTTPPLAPVISSQTRKTRDATPSTSGTAEPGTTVRLFAGSTEIGTTVVALTGTWTIASPSSLGSDAVYQITAIADDGPNDSPSSSAISITLDTTPPDAPTDLRTTAYHNCADLEWTASTAVDLAGYKIQRKAGAGSWTTLNTNLVIGTRYRDTTAVNGTAYSYRVIAVDNALDY